METYTMEPIILPNFIFYSEFDSGNLLKVEQVPLNESPVTSTTSPAGKVVPEIADAEFNIWTKPDCNGTVFQNGNRTWFYFGVKALQPSLLVKLNIVDLNRQAKMYSQGMAPVYRVIPGKHQWERIRDKPVYNSDDDIFTLSFKFKTPENVQSVTYLAFTYPFSYVDLQKMLGNIDLKFQSSIATNDDDIYFTNEVVCNSLEGRDVHLLTISSRHGITTEPETRLKSLFPETTKPRPFKFSGKKVIFISARVHPGETPSTFVFNGLLNLLLTREDPVAIMLRRLYVFKMIPFLNPDGVALGHYRTDTRGVNLNRWYLNPQFADHPPIFAARSLIRYHHFGIEKDDPVDANTNTDFINTSEDSFHSASTISTKVSHMTLEESKSENVLCAKCKSSSSGAKASLVSNPEISDAVSINILNESLGTSNLCKKCQSAGIISETARVEKIPLDSEENLFESGIALYIDMHGHASKKGIFMYGNHFDDLERNVECMLLPKLMSINNHNFHFTSCNFTERNMYLRDKRDGMSREGSGRVAVLKLTGLIKSYTLECNYNTGRIVNILPPTIREPLGKIHTLIIPPKYNPQVFEEVGKSLGASILDLTGQNPQTRIPNSEFHSLTGLQNWLRNTCVQDWNGGIPFRPKLRNFGMNNQVKGPAKARPPTAKTGPHRLGNRARPSTAPADKKEHPSAASLAAPADVDQRSKSSSRLHKNFKSKPKKDCSFKFNKRIPNVPPKSRAKTVAPQKSRLDTKLQKKQSSIKAEKSEHDKSKAKEAKRVEEAHKAVGTTDLESVATEMSGDSLAIGWKASSSSGSMKSAQEVNSRQSFKSSKSSLEAGTSKGSAFLVHNFSKNSSFPKCKFNKKHTLRRLTSASDASKVEKVIKRKKVQSK